VSRLTVALVGVNSPGYRSLGLDYLQAAVLADPRLDIALQRIEVDTLADPWWIAYRALSLKPTPDVVAFSVLCWTARHVYEAARLIKLTLPDVLIVAGGPEVGPIAEEVLQRQSGLDVIVRGEGEFAFPDLLHSHARGGDITGVAGVTARDGDRIVTGPDRPLLEDLDRLPSPFSDTSAIPVDGSAYVETYRGCPHRCSYCFEGKGTAQIRSFSWERIAADIDAVASVPGMQAFSFIDPVFNLTRDRLRRLAEILEPYAARGVRLHTIEVDIERIDDEQAELLKRCGVVSVETGPQTTGAAALAACHRGFDAARFSAGVEACKRVGISVECDLIVGLPGDSADDVLASIEFATALDPGRVQLSTLHVLPGTELWERADSLGLVFDPEPPHEIVSTSRLSYTDLRRLEVFGNAAAVVYQARLTPDTRSR
jgi:anaerobic magnesium-protoporphyrin IX monomethyl ester cyclase